MQRLTHRLTALIIIGATVVLVAACGSSSKPSSHGSSTTSSSSSATSTSSSAAGALPGGTPAKGAAIVIGTICSCSGPGASTLGLMPKEVSAWAAYVNAHGGLNGHPVKVIVDDDGANATTALQDAKSLVQQQHVKAIVGEESLVDSVWAAYVTKAGVPVIGGQPFDTPMWTDADFFPTGGNIVAATYGAVSLMKQTGHTKVALMYCAEAPACAHNQAFFKQMFATVPSLKGMSLAYSSEISASAPSYTAQCLAAKSDDVTAMFINSFPAVVSRVLDQCVQQGETVAQYNAGGDVGPLVWSDANAKGTLVTEYNVPVGDTTTPGAKLFHAVLAHYAPSVNASSPDWDDDLMGAWAGLQMFRYVADTGHLTPSSSAQDIKRALWHVHDQTLGGIAPPLSYTTGRPTRIDCWFVEGMQNKTQTLPKGSQPFCAPSGEETELYNAFG